MAETHTLATQELWRISNYLDLRGLGGERAEGRWHSVSLGKRIVYLAQNAATALHENLVHLVGATDMPDSYQLLRVGLTATIATESLQETDLPDNWRENMKPTQAIGDQWLLEARTGLLQVPSAPSPKSYIYLLNPLHTDASFIRVVHAEKIRYDRRYFRLAP